MLPYFESREALNQDVIYDTSMLSFSVSFPKLKSLPMLFTHMRYQKSKLCKKHNVRNSIGVLEGFGILGLLAIETSRTLIPATLLSQSAT